MLNYKIFMSILKKILVFLFLSSFFFISFFIYFQRNDSRGEVDATLDLNINFNKDPLQNYQKEIIGYAKTYFKNIYQAKNLPSENHLGNFQFKLNINEVDKSNFINYLNSELVELLLKDDDDLIFLEKLINQIDLKSSKQILLNNLILQLDRTTFNNQNNPVIFEELFSLNKSIFRNCNIYYVNYIFDDIKIQLDDCIKKYQDDLKFLQEIQNNILLSKSNFIANLDYITKFEISIQKTDIKKVIIRSIIASMIITLIFSLMLLSLIRFFKKND